MVIVVLLNRKEFCVFVLLVYNLLLFFVVIRPVVGPPLSRKKTDPVSRFEIFTLDINNFFPGTHIFLLSNTKSTHFFRLFFLIGHTSPKNGILCMDIFLAGSFTLPQRAATHLSGIINLGLGRRDVTGRTDTSSWSYVIIRHGYYPAERRLIRMVDQNGGKFRRL